MRKLGWLVAIFLMANVFLVHLALFKHCDAYYSAVHKIAKKFDRPQIKIFITYYKPYRLPSTKSILVPIQVGRDVEHEPFMKGQLSDGDIAWLHSRMIGDNTGDNISAKNRSFDVLTAYYWVWKHYKEIGNPRYIGFFAHRKGLNLGSKFDVYGLDYGIKKEKVLELLKKHKVISWEWEPYIDEDEGMVYVSMYEDYKIHHHIEDLDQMIRIIEQKYPEMSETMNEILYKKEPQAAWNFFIMEKKLAFEYFEKLFDVMFELDKTIGDTVNQRDFYQRRAYRFLAERFFAIWLKWKQKQGVVDPYWADVAAY